jgi:hypothetical protein
MSSNRIGKTICLGGIIIVLLLLLPAGVSATGFGPWSLQTVAHTGSVGQYSSVALDAAGKPAISFYDQTWGDLKYASWNGTGWVITTVDCSQAESRQFWNFWDWRHDRTRDVEYIQCFHGTGKVGKYSSLAFDGAGNPRISFYDESKGDLKFASRVGTKWVITTVDKVKNVGEYSSLALDNSGNPRISYYDASKDDLKYASWDGTRWVIKTVDSNGKVGEHSSLALDNSGNPRISYYDASNSNLKYASWDGNRWVISTVDGTKTGKGLNRYNWDRDYRRVDDRSKKVGQFSSLALDSSGNPRISYYDQTNKNLKYAAWNVTLWETTTVDSSRKTGEYTSLALDNNGNPRISYYDATHRDLKFAFWDSTASKWVTETVDSSGKVGSFSSLALDGTGNARISYYDQTNKDLKYAAGSGLVPTPSAPTITGITPSSGIVGTPVTVTNLAGTNFVTGTVPEVWLAKTGETNITATNVVVVSPTQITCTFMLPEATATSPGTWDVVVKNADGLSGMLAGGFTLAEPAGAPTVTGITPSRGFVGTTLSVTELAGTSFVTGTIPEVWLAKTGEANITATDVVVVSPTQITCTFTLPAASSTSLGAWDVIVKNTDGQSGTLAAGFTVIQPAVPVITSLTPPSGDYGTTVRITDLAGANFVVGTTPVITLIRTGESDIAATDVVVVSPTQITCIFVLPSAATPGIWNVVVVNADGQTGMLGKGFEITEPAAAPGVTGIIPSSGTAGTSVSVTSLEGTNFVTGTVPEVWLAKTGEANITATDVVVVSPTQITCALPLPASAAIGEWDVVVKNADGQIGMLESGFTVTQPPAPTVTGITPSSGTAGTTVSVTQLEGTNFVVGTTPVVQIRKTGEETVTATDVVVVSSTQITCTLALPERTDTSLGQWDIVVTNADGQSGTLAGGFAVKYDLTPELGSEWSVNGWEGWTHAATWTASNCNAALCSEYGPLMINGVGEHGINASCVRGTVESSVTRTFTAPYGTGYDTITFTGNLMDLTAMRSLKIDVNGETVVSETGSTIGNGGADFTVTGTFTRAPTVTVTITQKRLLASTALYKMQFRSLELSQAGSA